MKRVNEILAVVILSLLAVLLAAVGMRLYDTYVENRELEADLKQQEEVLSRNREAHDRVQEMRREIEELSGNREKLGQFLEEIWMGDEAAIPVSAMTDFGTDGMSGNQETAEQQNGFASEGETDAPGEGTISENTLDVSEKTDDLAAGGQNFWGDGSWSDNALVDRASVGETVSGNAFSVSGNTVVVSGNDVVSGNGLSVSGNDVVSGNGLGISGNDTDTVSGNMSGISGNGTVSENTGISERRTVSGNMLELLPKIEMVYPDVTLAERRQIRSSTEETRMANWEDQACLEERCVDFSEKKIACLGDSITAAANLEKEEGYLAYAYPSVLKEILGAEEVYNLGIGGSSIGRYWSDAFVERYAQIPEDTDIIIVMGGTNDGFCLSEKEFGSLTQRKPRTFCGDLDELMRGLKEKYPDADIFFATPLPNILQDYLMRERTYLLPQKYMADVILTLSAAHDFPVIDLYNSNILDSHDADIVADYMPDGVHANRAGYRILAEHMAAELVRYYEEG